MAASESITVYFTGNLVFAFSNTFSVL